MYPSFPSFEQISDLSIGFMVPNKRIVRKILRHSDEEEQLRIKAAGVVLFHKVNSLSYMISRHRICVELVRRNELAITLFLPPPPCPPPKQVQKLHHAQNPETTQLRVDDDDLKLVRTATEEVRNEDTTSNSEWITLYQYVPADRRHAMYARI
jgi:hypothetical protein